MMDFNHINVVAKKIATIFVENEATLSDMNEIMKEVKTLLQVSIKKEKPSGYLFSNHIPEQAGDFDRILNE